MAKLIATDNGSCELVDLVPYPDVVSTDATVGVSPVVGPDGKTTYDLAAKADSPWNNLDNSAATQASTDIKYFEGNVGIGAGDPLYDLHLTSGSWYGQTFNVSGGTASAYIQRNNDGAGNFHKYWNTEGTGSPTRISAGYALNEEFTGNDPWYQVRGTVNDAAGSAITWKGIHYLNMGTAQHRFPEYGDGVFDATNATRLLGVQSDGDVVEVPVVEPSNARPVGDNLNDDAIRTGVAGVSEDYSRADHSHPVVRQAWPDVEPTPTFLGTAGSTMTQVNRLDRWSTEETITYAWRCLVNHAAGETGWDRVVIPNMAGFQRPQITVEGTYRNSGEPSDRFPHAPYMGNEASHWSSTQHVYIGNYSAAEKPNACRRYVMVTVQYTRN